MNTLYIRKISEKKPDLDLINKKPSQIKLKTNQETSRRQEPTTITKKLNKNWGNKLTRRKEDEKPNKTQKTKKTRAKKTDKKEEQDKRNQNLNLVPKYFKPEDDQEKLVMKIELNLKNQHFISNQNKKMKQTRK